VTGSDHAPEAVDAARAWIGAVRTQSVAHELEAIFDLIVRAIDARAPVCEQSGRCCRFRSFGHDLFVTGLEVAYTLSRLDTPLTDAQVTAARAEGGCPFQVDGLCGVHTIKPVACRTFFCDPTATEWQRELTERCLGMLRRLHDRHGLAYRYGEWRSMMSLVIAAGP